MSVIVLPDAQADLLSLQEYMLDTWGVVAWVKAEDEIFETLKRLDAGIFDGAPVPELSSVGIVDYQHVFTSHHKLVYRRIGRDVYVYVVAGQRQDYPTLLARRLLRR